MRILIIRLSSLGDIVLAALLVRRIRETYPDSTIDLLTGPPYLQLLDAMPWLDGRWSADKGVAERYDIIIDLQNNIRSRRLAGKLDAARVIRYHRPRIDRFIRIALPFLRSRLSIPPQIARQYLAVAAGIGIVDDLTGPVLVPPPVWLQDAQDILTRHGCRGVKTVLIAPGGRHGTKIWPAERWIKLVEQMRLTGFEEFILIGAGDDFAPAVKIAAALPFPVVNLCGRTSIAELTGMIASAKLLICGDSGPMHIAAGTGTPVVAIFGPTVQEFGFAPFTEKARVVEVTNLSCRPCHPHGPAKCPQKHFRCMLEITPELVLQKALELAKPLVQS